MNILFIVPYAPTLIRVRPYNLIKSLVVSGHRLTLATPSTGWRFFPHLSLFTACLGGMQAGSSPWLALSCLHRNPSYSAMRS